MRKTHDSDVLSTAGGGETDDRKHVAQLIYLVGFGLRAPTVLSNLGCIREESRDPSRDDPSPFVTEDERHSMKTYSGKGRLIKTVSARYVGIQSKAITTNR
ncbi:hypothetical protein NDU88_003457 [Pleurodeles waltl]|uniref:Uncharacterized protein n=1 Tax=Pleurodeles waltl TaxID=8319 RepID=A0AAV7MUA9_PLEWA|nr:hypothetical protein NDU88_003457 [Pleurodeles waltl]